MSLGCTSACRVLVADRFLLDSELIAGVLTTGFTCESARPDDLRSLDLTTVELVLLDSECDDTTFNLACASTNVVGLLYDRDTLLLRRRSAAEKVRLAVPRSETVQALRTQIGTVFAGGTALMLPQSTRREEARGLSRREHEVLQLMASGLGNADIAEALRISPHTVRTHVQTVLAKMDRKSRVSAVGAARQAGLLTR